ncbi:uroporphyrinogen-III C-methyltransferase [Methyloversatilis sp.]|uniref:uroporphyrinogen-III C-methyltransferase n=1 Tax=Methyloversatilis sp. TaxID=2569862 RepID=UPI0027327627|nr:uroporphyrinogen-III C-methyltransferase [Methyloversatilis sp.]
MPPVASAGRTDAAPETAPDVRAARETRLPGWLLPVVVFVLIIFGLLSFFMVQRMRVLEAELNRRVAAVGAQAVEASRANEQGAEGIASNGERLGSHEVQLSELRSRIEAYEFLADDLVRTYDERALAEVEHALVLGQQQLLLAGDAKLALKALSNAEAQLARSDTGRYLPLRRAMANDMERLRRAPMADLAGQALRIDTLLGAIDTLPLAFERSPSEPPPPPAAAAAAAAADQTIVARLLQGIWGEFRQLVRIERLDRPDPVLLAPSHSFFLRENLKLRLVNARIALLQRNGAIWREDIRQAGEWVERYFDTRARATENALNTLRQLGMVDPGEALPDLNESMSALAQLKASRQRVPVVREGAN